MVVWSQCMHQRSARAHAHMYGCCAASTCLPCMHQQSSSTHVWTVVLPAHLYCIIKQWRLALLTAFPPLLCRRLASAQSVSTSRPCTSTCFLQVSVCGQCWPRHAHVRGGGVRYWVGQEARSQAIHVSSKCTCWCVKLPKAGVSDAMQRALVLLGATILQAHSQVNAGAQT